MIAIWPEKEPSGKAICQSNGFVAGMLEWRIGMDGGRSGKAMEEDARAARCGL